MTKTNTDPMPIGSSKNVAVNSQSSSKNKSAVSVSRKDSFNSHLDKANAQVNKNQNQNSTQQPEKVVGEVKDDASTSIQGQNTKAQDAPQKENLETPSENTSEEVEEISDADEGQKNPAIFSYFFSANTETLLDTRNFDSGSEGNLMTIMPQSSDGNSQTMLDLLGGKTWTSADVTSEFQNLNPSQFQVENLQPQANLNQQLQVENLQPQTNLNQQSQVENLQPQTNLNQQSQVENLQPQTNLNQQSQVENLQPQTNLNQQSQVENLQPQTNLNQQSQVENLQPQTNLNQQSQVENLQPQTNLNQQSQVENLQSQQSGQEISSAANSGLPQAQNQTQPTTQNLADMLGTNIQLEDGQQITPSVPTQPTSQNFEQNNSQSDGQNFSQDLAQTSSLEVQQSAAQTSEGGENFAANFAQANNISQPVSQTEQVQNPEAAQNARENFNIPTQIVEQARLIRNAQNTEMVINLKPEHLGELTLRISVNHSGTLNANFYSDNAQVRAIIENSLVQLKQELSNAGLKVEDVQVYAGLSDGGLSNGQGQTAWQQNQQQKNSNRRIDFSAFEEETDAMQPVNETESGAGVDYKV